MVYAIQNPFNINQIFVELPEHILEQMTQNWSIGLRYPPRGNRARYDGQVFFDDDPDKYLALFGLLVILKCYQRENYRYFFSLTPPWVMH